MGQAVRTAWHEFLYGGHLQCLGAVAILWTVSAIFRAPFPLALPLAAYAVTYAVYIYNRLLELPADAATNPSRTAYITSHRRTLWRVFFFSTVFAAVVIALTAYTTGAVLLAGIYVFGILYTNIFKALTRAVPGFKTWYVALGFAVLVFLPFAYAGWEVPVAVVFPFAAWVFWNAVVMQILLDVKDTSSDAQAGLRTVPVLLGRERAFRIVAVLTVLAAAPPLVWGWLHTSYPPEIIALAPAPLISLFALRLARHGAYRGYLIESGKFISWPALLVLAQALSV
jgi:4-hydroxybenzoate polyprenyltransferase